MFHLIFCADNNYIKFVAATMQNIISQTKTKIPFKHFFSKRADDLANFNKLLYENLSEEEREEGYIFHILAKDISKENAANLHRLCEALSVSYPCKVQIYELDDSKYKGTFAYGGSFVANFILEFDSFLPQNITKALALDLDMYVNIDLRELFSLDLRNSVLGVAENYTKKSKWFNTGFVLFNVPLWRKLHLQEQCIKYITTYKPNLPDQAALNICCKDKVLFLPLIFNLYPHSENMSQDLLKDENKLSASALNKEEWQELKQKAKIVHFLGCAKPWQGVFNGTGPRISFFRKLWWQNAFKTPIFKNELKDLAYSIYEDELWHCFLNLQGQIDLLKQNVPALSWQKSGAVRRFKNELPYKLGEAMMSVKPNFFAYLVFIFKGRKIIKTHQKHERIYNEMITLNPDLALPKLETYADFKESQLLKRHLTYRLGEAFLKAHQNACKGGYFTLLRKIEEIKKEF